MILNSTPQNEAIISNVGEIGEFRIRNSAKAFSILSSGLYANKIRAIIRELSCNAIDAQVAAGTQDTPFDVHLPNALEPHFSIRDYGTGLSHEQVTNIYTTYFESTKTASNEFIGALGLGSKSPFSYTDNFTVTAVKDGRKGVYTAFINEMGVPSIALMMEEETTDPNGVEVRFAVEERYDFGKFRDEARHVYEYFPHRPVVSGCADFKFRDPEYTERDIIPGVHTVSGHYSYAIMGNIKYPIDVPNSDKALGDLHNLLQCGLVMEFAIGELDFQASREGLSYIPETIASIKAKLEALNGQLAVHVATKADAIENLWERATFLSKNLHESLWQAATNKYVTDTNFALIDLANRYGSRTKVFQFTEAELAKKYNIVIKSFAKNRGDNACRNRNADKIFNNVTKAYEVTWTIPVSLDCYFVFNDTKVGATERSKYHWRNTKQEVYTETVFVFEASDKSKPVLKNKFLKAISNPTDKQVKNASDLLEKERAGGMGRNVTILRLERRDNGGWNRRDDMVWRDAAKADAFDDNTTYYYLPISGFTSLGTVSDVKTFQTYLSRAGLYTGTIYGVRKSDIEDIKKRSNWVNLDEHIKTLLENIGSSDVMEMVKSAIDIKALYQYNAIKHVDSNSPYLKLFNEFKDVKESDTNKQSGIEFLCKAYDVQTTGNVDPSALIAKYKNEVEVIQKRYPLLDSLAKYSRINGEDVAEYINAIDMVKAN
jgi:hypothetical protein